MNLQNFSLRGRVMTRVLLAGAAGLSSAELCAALGFGARTTVGWMLAEGQLELLAPGVVRAAPIRIRALGTQVKAG